MMTKWQEAEIPSTFDKFNSRWVPIKELVRNKYTISKGWYPIEKEEVVKDKIVDGWYCMDPQYNWRAPDNIDVGDKMYFFRNIGDNQVQEEGELVEKLPTERTVGVIPYRLGRFRIGQVVVQEKKVNTGQLLHFLIDDNERVTAEYGRLVEKLDGKKVLGDKEYKYGKFKLVKIVRSYTEWVNTDSGKIFKNHGELIRYVKIKKSVLSEEMQQLCLDRKIRIGMTKKMVLLSWGSPDDKNTSVSSRGRREQWIYRHEDFKADYLYFENGILDSFQLEGR
ncbi:hypothetical protein ACFL2O_11385 [Thermodesulfobacteriota bacterium]